tara:strand:- start:702 stop:1664 length:963 start_codon:yes stop_codon:yes gene_type:complete
MKQTVSVIIPTYNRAHLICETLDSIIAQSYTDWECIIIDDGSTDSTLSILEEYQVKDDRFHFYERPSDMLQGGNAARNLGYSKSSGIYIQWFDSDDVMLGNYLEERVAQFTEGIDFVICTGYSTDNNLNNSKEISIYPTNNLFKDYVLWNQHIVTQSVIFKKSFLLNKKLFSESILRGQETELFSRLFFRTSMSQYIIINKPLYLYRQHEQTKTVDNKSKYVSKFKESLAYISIANLERGIIVDDLDIINHHYQLLIHYFFNALQNKDLKTAFYIYRKLPIFLFRSNITLFLLFSVSGGVFLVLRRSYYRIEKQLKKYTI